MLSLQGRSANSEKQRDLRLAVVALTRMVVNFRCVSTQVNVADIIEHRTFAIGHHRAVSLNAMRKRYFIIVKTFITIGLIQIPQVRALNSSCMTMNQPLVRFKVINSLTCPHSRLPSEKSRFDSNSLEKGEEEIYLAVEDRNRAKPRC